MILEVFFNLNDSTVPTFTSSRQSSTATAAGPAPGKGTAGVPIPGGVQGTVVLG